MEGLEPVGEQILGENFIANQALSKSHANLENLFPFLGRQPPTGRVARLDDHQKTNLGIPQNTFQPSNVQVPTPVEPSKGDLRQPEAPMPGQVVEKGIARSADRDSFPGVGQQLEKNGIRLAGAGAQDPVLRIATELPSEDIACFPASG